MRLERGIISSKGLEGIDIGHKDIKAYVVLSGCLMGGGGATSSLATVRIGGLATYQVLEYTISRGAQMSAGHRSKVAARDVDGGRRGGGISKVALRTEMRSGRL
ncbi:uncharacterized protein PpBr36_05815 [Pyricularia pennisetigena]|uniref:uncharacterized protein n=1 Tax=Pyricularia pennisetigena TaxID=1578925 RepID=UPI00114D527D|nr:uncharacterized protein PpBr36_05815 [Pyricularia pennisetigena]TLS23492.1 hypothetical protein PpBr36_05815 [Pyricularia pennisetigena]